MRIIAAVPTNIITGFLGVGKTTAILNLLKNKPQQERWAILVNEFGEIGIDGERIAASHQEQSGVYIREIPGGCMCCVSGLPFHIALNMLLTKAKPDRLLIEPSGLGHPKEVLASLHAEHYQNVLRVNATLTMVDARKIYDVRYTNHTTFNQQLEVADILIANKSDQYQEGDYDALADYLAADERFHNKPLYATAHGEIPLAYLSHASTWPSGERQQPGERVSSLFRQNSPQLHHQQKIPECGFMTGKNDSEGVVCVGWRFSSEWRFNREKLFSLLSGVNARRIKAIFIANDGVYGYNMADNVLTEIALDDAQESRIEFIGDHFDECLQTQLLSCREELSC